MSASTSGTSRQRSALTDRSCCGAVPGSGASWPSLANDLDPDAGDALRILSISGLSAKGASIKLETDQADGQQYVAYTADADGFDIASFLGTTDTFTYVLKDSAGVRSTATVSVTVKPVADGKVVTGTNTPDSPLQGTEAVSGKAVGETIEGLNGNDELHGLGGADRLLGSNGDDRLFGGDGVWTELRRSRQ